jgi:Caspase domain
MWRLFFTCLAGIWLLTPGLARGAPPDSKESRRYAVIVANNSSQDEGVAALSYADDDGAKYFELFRRAGTEVKLLTVLDPAAQHRYPEAARAAVAPNHQELSAALDTFFARMRADRDVGRETHLFFVYAGHGNVGPNREGYLNLVDGPFRRSDLYREVLARSPATFNHVILDACHAYFVVNKRGGSSDKTGDFRSAVRDFLGTEELSHYPNTGVIFASSNEAETQEWSRWESGIFSHELRSALLGGGDVNGDGGVSYAEAAAFVEAANTAVDIPRARLRVFYRPPPLRADVALVEMSAFGGGPVVVVDAEHAGKYHVEDSRGVRIADIHSSRDHAARLVLVGKAPFFVRDAEREAQVTAEGRVEVRELAFQPLAEGTRGGIETTFRRHLFEVPFGPGFFQGVASAGSDSDRFAPLEGPSVNERSREHVLRPWAWASLAAAVATGAAGGVTYALAADAHEEYESATTAEEARALHTKSENRLTGARVLFGVAGAMAATGVTLLILDGTSGGARATGAGGAARSTGTAHVSAAFAYGAGAPGIVLSGRW